MKVSQTENRWKDEPLTKEMIDKMSQIDHRESENHKDDIQKYEQIKRILEFDCDK